MTYDGYHLAGCYKKNNVDKFVAIRYGGLPVTDALYVLQLADLDNSCFDDGETYCANFEGGGAFILNYNVTNVISCVDLGKCSVVPTTETIIAITGKPDGLIAICNEDNYYFTGWDDSEQEVSYSVQTSILFLKSHIASGFRRHTMRASYISLI
ncbi:MAG: hypothetical protein HUJ51_02700 [Eggerthellaceae bacterium]|nr:hypothetical protein [Eggerthellaceae bacterium]